MTVRPSRKKSKNPSYFSHEFIISNHGDIVSAVAMIIVMGLLYRGTQPLASHFVFIQHNTTEEEQSEKPVLFGPNRSDLCLIFFYTLVSIVIHCFVQENLFDRVVKKLNLTRVRLGKFNESTYLACFYAVSVCWGLYSIVNEQLITSLTSLWEGYPHNLMPLWTKLFIIIQICHWLHDFPELYFQRVKSDLIPSRVFTSSLFLVGISFAYIGGLYKLCITLLLLHYATDMIFHSARALHLAEYTHFSSIGFKVWNALFIPIRMACIILPVLVIHYGLGRQSVDMIDLSTGNFNTKTIRMTIMAFVFITQACMVWNFITFHQRTRRDKSGKSTSSWFGGSSTESNGTKRKEKKKSAKREEDDLSDAVIVDSDLQPQPRELRQRKPIKGRS